MKRLISIIFVPLLLAAEPAAALPVLSPERPPALDITPVAGDCYAVGQQVAAQNGGTLTSATASNQGGRTVCQIVVLIPPKDGQRPRRLEVNVPL